MTDYPPIPDSDWPAAAEGMQHGFAGGLNVYRTMAHHPALLTAWANLRDHIVNRTALGRELAEVVILRTGVRLGSDYEWNQHVSRARKFGWDDARIASMRGPLEGMAQADALLAGAVDELMADSALTRPTRDAVVAAHGTEGLFDLMATVGFYSTLGFILKTCGTPLDDDIAAELAAAPLSG